MSTSRPSPAAVAAVATSLRRAGVLRSTEIASRTFSAGFDCHEQSDHVQVTWTLWDGEDEAERAVHLKAAALYLDDYIVRCTTADVAAPGGWERQAVLEVRSGRWGR